MAVIGDWISIEDNSYTRILSDEEIAAYGLSNMIVEVRHVDLFGNTSVVLTGDEESPNQALGSEDDVVFASITVNNTGLHILDTDGSHDLIIAPGSNLTADRTLTVTTGDADRTLSILGNLFVESLSRLNQDLTTDASPEFTLLVTTAGMRTSAVEYGAAYWAHAFGESTPEHTNQVGSYDHTGGDQEKLVTKTAGDPFTLDDATNGNWIILQGANLGAVAEIKEFIDATHVTVDGMGWDGDLASQSFFTFKHPIFVSGNSGKHEFSVKSDGEFEVFSYGFTGEKVSEIHLDSAADNTLGLLIEVEANGYNLTVGQEIRYEAGDLQPGDVGGNLFLTINDVGATSADSTTIIGALAVSTTGASDATTRALVVLPGFTDALKVFGASAVDPNYGYETTATVSTDRVNGITDDTTAFLEASASDLELFENDDDSILIGSDSVFEIVQVILAVGSSKDIDADFFYSKEGGNWTTLVLQGESTNGMQNSGSIVFDAPIGWTKDDEDLDGNAITSAYYIAIQRTRVAAIVTLPTEDYFKTFSSAEVGMNIRGDGVVSLPYLGAVAPNPANGMVWMESDGLHIYYAGAEKLVAGV